MRKNIVPPVVKNKVSEIPLESKVESYFKRQIAINLGAKSWKFSSPNHRGVSDQVMICNSLVIFVEMKRVTGKISPKQESFYRTITEHGGLCCFIFGHSGVDQFVEFLRTLFLAIKSAESLGCSPPLSSYQSAIKKEYR